MTTKQWLFITVPMLIIIAGLIVLLVVPRSTEPAQNLSSGSDEPGGGSTSASSTSTTPSTSTSGQASLADTITVTLPLINTKVTSPFTITGKARGTWYFEASAPVELRNAAGTVIAQAHVTASGDWMTTEYVPFTATLTFATQPAGSTGTLVLTNDNPSGDPSRQKELDIPVTF